MNILLYNSISLSKYIDVRKEWKVYYDIVESGLRIKALRSMKNITRTQLAEMIGISVDALRKVETGYNGAKIDTLVILADLFHVSLDFLVCGCERKEEIDSLLTGLNDREIQFVRNMVISTIENMKLIRE